MLLISWHSDRTSVRDHVCEPRIMEVSLEAEEPDEDTWHWQHGPRDVM